MTADNFFRCMPYILDKYEFVKDPNPDFVIYSTYHPTKPPNCTRIFYTPENVIPNMDNCDWAFSFVYDEELQNPRHMRFPNYKRVGCGRNLLTKADMEPDRKFCAFIYSNSSAEIRNQFFKKLSEYKRVDSPGCVFRNMPRFGTACLQSDLFHAEKIVLERLQVQYCF